MDRSCVDSSDWYGTGGYDPDGDGGVGPFSIECDGDYLVFHHSQEALKRVHGYAPNVSAHAPLLTRIVTMFRLKVYISLKSP